ncbi:MAG: S-layer homology domain-containing protein [Lachnospiraceae bacterium]|nr:S-layer homology domain-containing protein [Lachnospiraceae bacterium]
MKSNRLAAAVYAALFLSSQLLSPLSTGASDAGVTAVYMSETDDDTTAAGYGGSDFYDEDDQNGREVYSENDTLTDEAEPDVYGDDDPAEYAGDAEQPDAFAERYEAEDAGYPEDDADETSESGAEAMIPENPEVSSEAESMPADRESIVESKTIEAYEMVMLEPDAAPDELFEKYFENQFYERDEAASGQIGERLFGNEKFFALRLYRELERQIKKIAAEGGSTIFTVEMTASKEDGFTDAELEYIWQNLRPYKGWTQTVTKMFRCLASEYPYELYWYDRNYGCYYGIQKIERTLPSKTVSIVWKAKMPVSIDYAPSGEPAQYEVTTDVSRVKKAVSNAKRIVSAHAKENDWDRLLSFKNEICNLTNYNAGARFRDMDGDPWQLIYVFDGDPKTRVVCEGYAKAFQFLCNLANFKNTVSYLMTGTLNDTDHMWNVVKHNGKTYLCDITNCDSGYSQQLFMVSDTGNAAGYTIQLPGRAAVYRYDSGTIDLFPESIRKLSTKGSVKFKDVQDAGKFYYYPVIWALDTGITNGTDGAYFYPEQIITRGQMITFLYRMEGSPDVSADNGFIDVSPTSYCAKAVTWAVQKGITSGITADTFSPDQGCTRGQIVTFLYRYKGSPSVTLSNSFKDVPKTIYCAKSVAWAVQKGITSGTSSGYFSPDQACTRGQALTFMYRSR